MKKHIFIFGNNSLAILLHYYLHSEDIVVEGFCLNKKYIKKFDLPLECYAIEDVIDKYGAGNVAVYVTIAYVNMNKTREVVSEWLTEQGVEILNYIHPSAVVASNVDMGHGNILLEQVAIQPFVKIGNGNIFWNNTTISHHSILGNYNYLAAGVTIAGKTNINNRSFWGCNSTSANDIIIEDDVLIGAGAYLYKDIKHGSVFVPQRGIVLEKESNEINLV